MPRERGHIGHNHVVSKGDVMRHMRVSQDMIVGSEAGDFSVSRVALRVAGRTDRLMVADLRAGEPALPFQILRLKPKAGEGKNLILAADSRDAINHDVRVQPAVLAYHHLCTNHAVRPYEAACANFGLGMHDCRWMDVRHQVTGPRA